MHKRLLFFWLWGAMIFLSSAGTQGGTRFESMNIELWAEYDRPSMLVIHEFTVDENTTLPAQVTLRFHKDANLIAVASNNGVDLVNAEFEGPEEQGDWQIVIVKVQSRDPHRIEYYQPLRSEGNKRKFSFRWFGDYSVREFNLSALLPLDSANIITSPVLARTSRTSNGLYLTNSEGYGKLRMGEAYEFDIEYTRESPLVSDATQVADLQASDPVGPDTPGRASVDKLPWIIGGFGIALIAVILFFFSYWRSMQSDAKAAASGTGPRLRRRRGGKNGSESVYCHECGTRAQAGDRFCRICGSKLRVE